MAASRVIEFARVTGASCNCGLIGDSERYNSIRPADADANIFLMGEATRGGEKKDGGSLLDPPSI